MPKSGNPAPSRNDIWWWDDYDDFRPYFRASPLITDITVFEEDKEPIVTHIGLCAADGSAIVSVEEHPGLGFIGFIDPDTYEDYRKPRKKRARKLKGKKNADALKS